MKKILFTISAAALVLAGCAKIETVKVDENRAIEFSSFVNKPTKAEADIDNTNFTQFWVYGAYQNTSNWVNIFTNVQVTGSSVGSGAVWTPAQNAYWTADAKHNFAAYANGEESLNDENITFDAANAALTFNEYTVGDNDLVVARAFEQSWDGTNPTEPNPVYLTFKHMLSKVKFTFTTTDSEDYVYKVTDLQIAKAYTKGNGNYNGNVTWNFYEISADGAYMFGKIDDFAVQGGASAELYVIPQSNELLKASFTITAYDNAGNEIGSNSYKDVSVAYTGTETETNKWTPGFSYNYTATVTLPQIIDNVKPITFDVIKVEEWTNVTDGTNLTL